MSDGHFATMCRDELDFCFIECSCGWRGEPCPGESEAIDGFGDHRAEQA